MNIPAVIVRKRCRNGIGLPWGADPCLGCDSTDQVKPPVYTGFMDWQAFWLTIRLAFTVTLLLLLLGFPLAYWIAFSRWRWKFLVEAVVALPIVLPPTVLGFYLLIALGPRSPLGRWWQALTGHTLALTFEGLVIGSIIYSLPFAVQPFSSAFDSVDRRLLAASATLGASQFRT